MNYNIINIVGIACFICGVILIFFYFKNNRHINRDISKLSSYLRRISSGDYSLDIRDNKEGELSILKNEIYKVTVMLSEKSNLYEKDQKRLAEVIADISHQLKTPLTSMMIMADLLGNDDLDAEKRIEFTKCIQTQLERMEWLLSSLLKLSKIDSGTAVFKKENIRVLDLINKAKSSIIIPMEVKKQSLSVYGDPNVTYIGDLDWSTEAVINILKNCVENTQDGGNISINFQDNPLYTEIIIKDNGRGIPKEDLPCIFKRFYRGKNAGKDSVGIGLAMAKSIVGRQSGDITAESTERKGTSFFIKFYKHTV
ncbi:HAMP domain-containing sensor histidine kinase [Anaerovorax odorimutans]|uniref:HAMP domain-containing sensor histidine kinase n=1 Tax=Anaerovorax odorimutans TaxID=109327 RepID=UPI00041C2F1B|nr:HAMP domain-containing sensor histidine kinase [Anaerovorax odorimutans]